jgi:hypothetical protein
MASPPSGAAESHALVTGASSGIGAAFARTLAARGWRLVLVARRADRLTALAHELGPERTVVLPVDLARPEAADDVERALAERGVAVELLVNNAGVGHTGRFVEQPEDRLLQMVDLNARAMVALTRRLLPAMVARGRGAVVNVVSTSAFQPVPYLAIYGASKAFALSFTEALADELRGTGVRVQALCPGLTATEFQEVAGTDQVLFNRTGSMTPAVVAEASLAALERGRLRVIPGWSNRLVAAAQAWAPRWIVRRVGAALFRPRQ